MSGPVRMRAVYERTVHRGPPLMVHPWAALLSALLSSCTRGTAVTTGSSDRSGNRRRCGWLSAVWAMSTCRSAVLPLPNGSVACGRPPSDRTPLCLARVPSASTAAYQMGQYWRTHRPSSTGRTSASVMVIDLSCPVQGTATEVSHFSLTHRARRSPRLGALIR